MMFQSSVQHDQIPVKAKCKGILHMSNPVSTFQKNEGP